MTGPVAVIVLNWNGWRDTVECLESLRRMTYPAYRIIVVDNGSTDGSADQIEAWARATGAKISLIRNPANLGFGAGNNVGIREALIQDFVYLCLLNNDTVVEPDLLDRLVGALDRRPDWGVVGPKILYKEDRARIWCAGVRRNLWTVNVVHDGMREPDGPQWTGVRGTECVSGCCLMARREVFARGGLLDEDLFFCHEEWAFAHVVERLGLGHGVDLDARIYHRSAASIGEGSPRYQYYSNRNRLVILKKYGSATQQIVGGLFYACTRPIKFVRLLLRGNAALVALELSAVRDFLLGRYGDYDRALAALPRARLRASGPADQGSPDLPLAREREAADAPGGPPPLR